jgi:hypothetical protein
MGVLGPRVAQCKVRVLARETGAAQSGVRTTVWTDKGRTQLGDAAGAHTDTHGRSSFEVPADRELIVIAHGDRALIGGGHASAHPTQLADGQLGDQLGAGLQLEHARLARGHHVQGAAGEGGDGLHVDCDG